MVGWSGVCYGKARRCIVRCSALRVDLGALLQVTHCGGYLIGADLLAKWSVEATWLFRYFEGFRLVREGKGIIDDTGQACFQVDLALIDG